MRIVTHNKMINSIFIIALPLIIAICITFALRAWIAMTAISTSFMALFILVAGLVAYWQLKENTDLRKQQAWIAMLKLWKEEDARIKRRFVLHDFKFNEKDELEDLYTKERIEGLNNVEYILGICETVSLMVHKKLVSEEDVLESIGDALILCHERCKYFIEARNNRRNIELAKEKKEFAEQYTYMHHLQNFVVGNRGKIHVAI